MAACSKDCGRCGRRGGRPSAAVSILLDKDVRLNGLSANRLRILYCGRSHQLMPLSIDSSYVRPVDGLSPLLRPDIFLPSAILYIPATPLNWHRIYCCPLHHQATYPKSLISTCRRCPGTGVEARQSASFHRVPKFWELQLQLSRFFLPAFPVSLPLLTTRSCFLEEGNVSCRCSFVLGRPRFPTAALPPLALLPFLDRHHFDTSRRPRCAQHRHGTSICPAR